MSNFIEAFGNGRKVVIPSIQRDYVQPLNESIIKGFVEVLIDSFASDDKTIKDLNYLYGITEVNGDFTPIDGQQRLTTLWLLHLYVAKHVGTTLHVHIEYQTRDISGDFCKALSDNFLNVDMKTDSLSKNITDSPWFISYWEESVTVKSILLALDYIHSVSLEIKPDFSKMWKNMNKGSECPVIFAFYNPTDLGKDIYVKMNSRGKSLSRFENLKAWLDDKLKELQAKHSQHSFAMKFYQSWRADMDNAWTDIFWQNRNLNSAFPEEIDDAQLRMFYTIAYIVWAEKKPAIRQEAWGDSNKLLELMRKSSVEIATYELNKYNIFNEEFFLFARKALTGLIRIQNVLNTQIQAVDEKEKSDKIVFWDIPDTKQPLTLIYQLLLNENNDEIAYPKLVLTAATLYFASNHIPMEDLPNWMRFTRNIVNNNSDNMRKDYIHNILAAFRTWAKQLKRKGWNKFITELTDVAYIDKNQIKEEKRKYSWVQSHPECSSSLYKLENHRFFFGRISYLLDYMGNRTPSLFNIVCDLMSKLFDKDGPQKEYQKDYLFQRVILALSEKNYGYGRWISENSGKWSFPNSKEDWKKFLEDSKDNHNIGISTFLDILIEQPSQENVYEVLLKILKEKEPSVFDWRSNLIKYNALWEYMQNKYIQWQNENAVFLIMKSNMGKTNKRAELRSFGLYQYFLSSIFSSNESLNGWSLKFWDMFCTKRKNSCFFFQKEINDNDIALDVFFDTHYANNGGNENSYVIEIFDRRAQKEHSREINELSLSFLNNIMDNGILTWNENNNLESGYLTKEEVISLINQIIPSY